MEQYKIYCTPEQTKTALELGADIKLFWNDIKENFSDGKYCKIPPMEDELGIMCEYAVIPTAEQMIGWLEEHIDNIDVLKNNNGEWIYLFYPTSDSSIYECEDKFPSRKEATLAAIDVALDYLIGQKEELKCRELTGKY